MALSKQEKEIVTKDFGRTSSDTGSSEVQIALLTKNIQNLTSHCQKYKGDFSGRRGLLKMVCQRRRFLRYLERMDFAKYKEVAKRLELRGS